MEYLVIKKHKSNYPNPITVKKGERVLVGKKYNGEEDWKNWIYCYKTDKSQEGWIPLQLLAISDQYGVLKKDYSAKELTISKGEKVEGINELNGWVWCKDSKGRTGWIPKMNLERLGR